VGTVRDSARGSAFRRRPAGLSSPVRRTVVGLLVLGWLLFWYLGVLVALSWVGDEGVD
jgi:hypothetical protein